jgi:vacuolar-type H+-ATPase subunit I/STV1
MAMELGVTSSVITIAATCILIIRKTKRLIDAIDNGAAQLKRQRAVLSSFEGCLRRIERFLESQSGQPLLAHEEEDREELENILKIFQQDLENWSKKLGEERVSVSSSSTFRRASNAAIAAYQYHELESDNHLWFLLDLDFKSIQLWITSIILYV